MIDKIYEFQDNEGICTSVRLQLDHDSLMLLGETFQKDEEYYEVDNFIKDEIDEANARSIAENLYEQWMEDCDSDETKTIDDFYDEAWDYLGESVLYYLWSDELKSDCIKYYKEFLGE